MNNAENTSIKHETVSMAKLIKRRESRLQELASLDERIRAAENQKNKKDLAQKRTQDNQEKAILGGLSKAVNLDRFRLAPEQILPRGHNLNTDLIAGALLQLSSELETLTEEDLAQLAINGRAFLGTPPKRRTVPGRMSAAGMNGDPAGIELDEWLSHGKPGEGKV